MKRRSLELNVNIGARFKSDADSHLRDVGVRLQAEANI